MAIKARYLGDGTEFLNGIPAASLSEEEYAALDAEQRTAVRQTKQSNGKLLYDVRTDAEMHPAASASDKPADGKAAKGGS
jgi:hypothetical protein